MKNNLPGAQESVLFHQLKKSKKTLFISIGFLLIILVVFMLINGVNKSDAQTTNSTINSKSAQPLSTQLLNRNFKFSVKDKADKVITTFDYKIINAQVTNEVIINGQKYNPITGKTFLVINLEITNNFTQTITILPRDYVRVLINHSAEKLAPDIYNDPVDVQAISTKPNKLALAINATDKNIALQVGEITGIKTIIPLTLHY